MWDGKVFCVGMLSYQSGTRCIRLVPQHQVASLFWRSLQFFVPPNICFASTERYVGRGKPYGTFCCQIPFIRKFVAPLQRRNKGPADPEFYAFLQKIVRLGGGGAPKKLRTFFGHKNFLGDAKTKSVGRAPNGNVTPLPPFHGATALVMAPLPLVMAPLPLHFIF